jgi:hypothetical protein
MTNKKEESHFIKPYPTPEKLKPRVGYSELGFQARKKLVHKYGSALPDDFLKVDKEQSTFSVVFQKNYSSALSEMIVASKKAGRMLTARDLMHVRAGGKPRIFILEGICPPLPEPDPGGKWEIPTRTFWQKQIDEFIKQELETEHEIGGVKPIPIPSPDLDSAPNSLCPGSRAVLTGSSFGNNEGRVLMTVASGQSIDLIISSWSETRIDAYLDPNLSGLRRYGGEIWVVTARRITSNAKDITFRPMLAYHIAFDGICVQAGPWGYPVTEWPVNDPENLTVNNGQSLGDSDFEIINVNHWHEGDGHSELVEPHASGQSLSQGIHIGLSAFERGCAEIMYTIQGPRGIAPPSVSELEWGFLGDGPCS